MIDIDHKITKFLESDSLSETVEKRVNPSTGKSQYCLVSVSNPDKILKWWTHKPSDEDIEHEEKRVRYFKNLKK